MSSSAANLPATKAARPALRPFGALRFVLALLVVLHHFGIDLAPPWLKAIVIPVAPGDIAVTVFFALSGFIILEAASNFYAGRPVPFFVNRALRILPGFAAALIVAVLVHVLLWRMGSLRAIDGAALGPEVFSARNILANLLSVIPLSGKFGPAIDYLYLWPVWSLRVELVFYAAVFAALCVAAWRGKDARGDNIFLYALAVLAASALAANVWALVSGADSSARFGAYFVFGGAVFLAWRDGTGRGSRVALAVAVLCVPLIFMQMWNYNAVIHAVYGRSHTGQIALLVLLLAGFVWLAAWSRRVPGKWDRALGELAYPLFLNHLTIGAVIRSLYPGGGIVVVLAGFALSVALAAAMQALVEPAIRSWRNSWRGVSI